MHRPARETLRLAVFDSERARVRSSRLLRASEREREPQEREREKERASSRATLVQKVSETTQDDCCCCSWCAEEKKGEKKAKKGGRREDFITYDAKRKRAALLSMAIKISPFFFVSKEELDCEKKGGFVVVGKNWLGNFR